VKLKEAIVVEIIVILPHQESENWAKKYPFLVSWGIFSQLMYF
jgi:hypothetical protein